MSNERRFYIGCDLGKRTDYTAICIVEKFGEREMVEYGLRHIERLDLGTPYPQQVERIRAVYAEVEKQADRTRLVLDLTGVGEAVGDLLRDLHPTKVWITGASRAKELQGYREYSVPKGELAATVQVLLQRGKLHVADGLSLAEVLREELLNFRVKVSDAGNARFEHAAGEHDDLVLALALALWQARRDRYGRAYIIS